MHKRYYQCSGVKQVAYTPLKPPPFHCGTLRSSVASRQNFATSLATMPSRGDGGHDELSCLDSSVLGCDHKQHPDRNLISSSYENPMMRKTENGGGSSLPTFIKARFRRSKMYSDIAV